MCLMPSSLNLSQGFSTNARKMVPYSLSTSVCRSCVSQRENLAIARLDCAQLRDKLQLYCLAATPYLQDNCYMLPTVGNNQALSSRVMVKLKLTTNTWHRLLPPCLCSSGKRVDEHHTWLPQNPLFLCWTGKYNLSLSPQQAFPHLWCRKTYSHEAGRTKEKEGFKSAQEIELQQ